MNYKAGDTVQIEGCRMNGYEHTWTLTVAEVYPEHYDPATDSFLQFRSTTGHQLWSDIGGEHCTLLPCLTTASWAWQCWKRF